MVAPRGESIQGIVQRVREHGEGDVRPEIAVREVPEEIVKRMDREMGVSQDVVVIVPVDEIMADRPRKEEKRDEENHA
jgi:hypothetical protein